MHIDRARQTIFSAARIRILHPNALQLGNVAISWNPAAGKPTVHGIKVYRDNVARDVLATTKFEVLRREDQLGEAMLNGILTATLRVPDLQVGDELEMVFSVPAQDPTLGADSYGFLYLLPNPSPGRFALRLTWDEGQQPNIRNTPDIESQITRGPQSVAFTADMPAALVAPKFAPPRYQWKRVIEFSDYASWRAMSARIAPLFRDAAALPASSPIRQEVDKIAAENTSQMGRAAAALKVVQQKVRYVYVGLNGGNIKPASVEETWQRRYGDCKGKTVLLLAMLKELGIEAEAVLASNAGTDDGTDQRLPSPNAFDHVLVRAKIDGKTYWLDGTLPPVFPLTEDPIFPYRWVLPLTEAGAELDRVPWKPETKPEELVLYEIDARNGFDQPALKKTTTIRRGSAAIQEYYQLSSVSDDQMQTAYRQEMEGSSGWDSVETVKWRFDSKEMASVTEITGRGPIDWDIDGPKSKSFALPGAGFSPPERRQRGSDQDQAAPYFNTTDFSCHVTTFRFPSATAPKDWSFNSSFDTVMYGETYRRSFEKRDGAIRMIRSTRTLQQELDPQNAAKDNERLGKFDNSMGWVYHDLGSYDRPGPGEVVPATYEIDWLADSSPCLAPKHKEKAVAGVAKGN